MMNQFLRYHAPKSSPIPYLSPAEQILRRHTDWTISTSLGQILARHDPGVPSAAAMIAARHGGMFPMPPNRKKTASPAAETKKSSDGDVKTKGHEATKDNSKNVAKGKKRSWHYETLFGTFHGITGGQTVRVVPRGLCAQQSTTETSPFKGLTFGVMASGVVMWESAKMATEDAFKSVIMAVLPIESEVIKTTIDKSYTTYEGIKNVTGEYEEKATIINDRILGIKDWVDSW